MTPIVTMTLNPCIDENTSVDRVFPDHKLRCQAPHYEAGGGGINVARAIRRLGGESLAIYPSGGPAGELLRLLLEKEGVAQRPVPIAAWTRENLSVFEERTGRQFRFVLPGPTLTTREWEGCLDQLEALQPAPDFVVASGSLPPGVPIDFYARLARLCKRLGARFALDASGEPARLALEESVFLFKPSLREFQALTGVEKDDATLEAEGARLVAAGHCEVLVVSLGESGALLVTAQETRRLESPSVTVRSTVGAGDSMMAGAVLRLHQGWRLSEAVAFGMATAAATVMNSGTELCRREDAERLYALALPISA